MKAVFAAFLVLLASPALASIHGSASPSYSGGVSGGETNSNGVVCPYDTYASDGCDGAPLAYYSAVGSTTYFTTVANQSGQSYTYTGTGSITGSVLTVTGGTSPNVGDTITMTSGSVSLPAGVYVASGSGPYTLSGSGATMPSGTFTGIHRPPNNLCGVDYNCGVTTSIASHVDPTTNLGLYAPGCTQTTQAWGAPLLHCTLSGDTTYSNWDLSPTAGHDCIWVTLYNTVHNATFKNIYFDATAAGGACQNKTDTSGLPILIDVGSGSSNTGNDAVVSSTFYGRGDQAAGWMPGSTDATGLLANQNGNYTEAVSFSSTGTRTIHYTMFDHWPGQTWGLTGVGTCPDSSAVDVSYNYLDTNHTRAAQGHAAAGSFGCNDPQSYTYNVFTWSPVMGATLTTQLSGSTSPGPTGTWNVVGNWIGSNTSSGGSTSNITISFHLDATTGAIDIDSTSGTIQSGMSLSGLGAWLVKDLSGGSGTQWSYDCGNEPQTANTNAYYMCWPFAGGGSSGNAAAIYNRYQSTAFIFGTNQNCSGTIASPSCSGGGPTLSTSNTFSGITAGPLIASTTPLQLLEGTFAAVNVTGNYVDPTGNAGGGSNILSSAGTSVHCTATPSPSGNINALTGAAMNGKTGSGTNCFASPSLKFNVSANSQYLGDIIR